MNKRKIIGLSMTLIGVLYMVLLFLFTSEFEKLNDTLCFILTIISVVLIIWGVWLFFIKTPEEHFKEEAMKKEENIKLSKYYKYKPYFTYILVAINVLLFLLINVKNGDNAVLKYAISRNNFEFYKLFSSMFTHVNESHIIFNMLALCLCGSKLESLIGNTKYLLVYLISGVGSSILIALFSINPCVGASGAIFGLFGCYLLIALKNRNVMKYTYKYDLLPTIIMNLIVTFVVPSISKIAHVGGVILGIICYLIFFRKLKLS